MRQTERVTKWSVVLWLYAPLFIWIGVIFFLSSSSGSMSHTSMFIRPILNFLFPTAPEETLQLYHAYIRKAAHFTEYAVLAFLAIRAFRQTVDGLDRRFIYGSLVVVAVACFDEFNQSFEISRTGSMTDVLLDISGGITMIAILWCWQRLRPAKDG